MVFHEAPRVKVDNTFAFLITIYEVVIVLYEVCRIICGSRTIEYNDFVILKNFFVFVIFFENFF